MKSSFLSRLVNGPYGDPGLHIDLRWQGEAIQFDIGRIDRFPAAEILKVSHVLVSHTHMDHFFGFDRLLRLFLAREATVHLYGPAGFIANVRGRLAGYTWNLVDGYPLTLIVNEITTTTITTVELRATDAFAAQPPRQKSFDGVAFEGSGWRVRTAILNHKIPCLAFAVEEDSHLNVRKEELERLGIPAGRWLNQLKDAIRSGEPDNTQITAEWRLGGEAQRRELSLGELRDRLLVESRGQKVAYVVDTLFSVENAARIAELAAGADIFYCESPFLDEDREEALKRYHLTARQAGSLARMASVRRLEVFHFSPRYDGRANEIYDEADATFRGEIEPDVPVNIPG